MLQQDGYVEGKSASFIHSKNQTISFVSLERLYPSLKYQRDTISTTISRPVINSGILSPRIVFLVAIYS